MAEQRDRLAEALGYSHPQQNPFAEVEAQKQALTNPFRQFGQSLEQHLSQAPIGALARGDVSGFADQTARGIAKVVNPTFDNAVGMLGGIKAFHGSPHSFEKFSLDKIGTGEGAQAYGHGLYFAENENIAQSYRDALSSGKEIEAGGRRVPVPGDDYHNTIRPGRKRTPETDAAIAIDYATEYGGLNTFDSARDFLRSNGRLSEDVGRILDDWERVGAEVVQSPGSMYEVEINADPARMLDWDAPLSEQGDVGARLAKAAKVPPTYTGRQAYQILADEMAPSSAYGRERAQVGAPIASETLKAQGIPGIKYKDAASRGGDGGTRNFVVFDDSLVNILKKYGLVPPALAGAGASLQRDSEQ